MKDDINVKLTKKMYNAYRKTVGKDSLHWTKLSKIEKQGWLEASKAALSSCYGVVVV